MKSLEPFAAQEPKVRVFIEDSSQTDGRGLASLAFDTTGLVIRIVDDIGTAIYSFTVAGSTIETISSIGTYAVPTATKCRFAPVDNTNFVGLYEIHLPLAIFAAVGTRKIQGYVFGPTNARHTRFELQLTPAGLFGGVVAYGVINNPSTTGGTIPDTPSGARLKLRIGQRLRFLTGVASSEPRFIDAVNTSTGVYTVSPAHDNDPGSGDVPFVVEDAEPAPTTAAILPTVSLGAASLASIFTTAMVEAYSTAGGTMTFAQFVYEVTALLQAAAASGVTLTTKKRDGATTAMTHTLDDADDPTSIVRAS